MFLTLVRRQRIFECDVLHCAQFQNHLFFSLIRVKSLTRPVRSEKYIKKSTKLINFTRQLHSKKRLIEIHLRGEINAAMNKLKSMNIRSKKNGSFANACDL